jgi:hypothetical protein
MLFVAAGRELLRTTAFQPLEFPSFFFSFPFLAERFDGTMNVGDGHSSIWSGRAIMVCEKSEYSDNFLSVNIQHANRSQTMVLVRRASLVIRE